VTVQARIEVYTGSLASYSATLAQVVSDATWETIHSLPADSLTTLWAELTDSGSGVDTTAHKVLEARKDLYPAYEVSPSVRASSRPTAATPVYYTWAGKTWVLPGGGTVLACAVPSVTPSAETVTNVPDPLLRIVVLESAKRMLSVLTSVAQRDITVALTLPTAPSAPAAPVIAYSDASAVAVTTAAVGSIPTAPTYGAPSLAALPTTVSAGTLDLTKKVDGVTSLPAPTAPSDPSFTYSDAAATAIGSTTIIGLPTPPTYATPMYSGSLSLPTLPTLDATREVDGVTANDPPTALGAPALAAVDAAVASVVATTVASLGTAPAYTKPSFAGSLLLPTLPTDLNLGTLTLPTAPTAPTIAYVDAAASTVVVTAIGLLPTPPALSAITFGGTLLLPTLPTLSVVLKADGATALNPPAALSAPTIASVDAAASSVVASTLANLGTVPAYTKPTFGGTLLLPTLPTLDLTKKLDGVTTLTVPSLAAPALAAVDAAAASVVATTVGTIPGAPTYTAPTYGGSLTIPTLTLIDLTKKIDGVTANNPPAAPGAPTIAASDATAATVAAVTFGTVPGAPTYTAPTWGGSLTLPTLPTLAYTNRIDGVAMPALPSLPGAPAVSYVDAALGTFAAAAQIGLLPTPPTLTEATFGGDIAAALTALPTAIDLAKEFDGDALTMPAAPATPTITSAGVGAVAIGSLGTAPTYVKPGGGLVFTDWDAFFDGTEREDPEIMAEVVRKIGLELDVLRLSSEEEWREFQKEAEIYRATTQSAIEQARLTVQENVAEMNAADQAVLQNYALKLQQHQRDLAVYEAHVANRYQKFQADLARHQQGYLAIQKLWLEKYQTDAQEKIAAFNGAVQDHMRECDRLIQQASLDQEHLRTVYERTADLNLQNKARTAETAIANYQQSMVRYRESVLAYQTDVTLVNQKWELDYKKAVEPWVEQQRLYMQQYADAITAARDALAAQVEKFRGDLQKVVDQARITSAESLAQAQLTTDIAARNKANALAASIRDWEADLEVYQAGVTTYTAEMQRVVEKWKLDYEKTITAWVEQQRLYHQSYALAVESARDAANAQTEKYRADVQKVIAQAQTTLQEALTNAQLSTDIAARNKAQALTGAIADFDADVRVFEASLSAYQAEANRVIETWRINFQKAVEPWAAQQKLYLEQYALDVQNEKLEFEKELAVYQQDAAHKIEAVRTILQEALANAQNSTEVAVRNKAQTLAALIADWEADAKVFEAGLAGYQAEVGRVVETWRINFQKAVEPWAQQQKMYLEQYALDVENEKAEFEKDVAIYRQDAAHKIEQVRATLQEALTNAQNSTEVAIRNKAQTLAAAIADWDADTKVYQSALSTYEQEISRVLEKWKLDFQKAYEPWLANQQLYLQKYTTDLQQEVEATKVEVVDYELESKRLMDQAQVTLQEALANARASTDVAMQNRAKALEAAIADWQGDVQKFEMDLAKYREDALRTINQFEGNLKKATIVWADQQRLYVEQYSLDIQNEKNEFEKDLAIYRQDAEHKIAQAQGTLQEALANAQNSTEVALRNKAQTLAGAIRDWEADVEVWRAALDRYSAELGRVVQKWDIEFRKAVEPWAQQQKMYLEKYSLDVQVARDSYEGAVQDHMRECDRVIEQARLDQERLATAAKLETDVSIQNELQTAQNDIAEYESKLVLYRDKTQLYGLEVDAVVKQYSEQLARKIQVYEALGGLSVARYQAESQDAAHAFEGELAEFRAGMDKVLLQANILRQEYEQASKQATEVAVANKAQGLAAAIADWEADLGRYRVQVEAYGVEATTTVQKRQSENETRRDRVRMLGYEIDRVAQELATAKDAYLKAYTRRRPMQAWHHDF
jgi:hypothetical protein